MLYPIRLQQLKRFVTEELNLKLEDCCFIGGMSLENLELRIANDIDLCLTSTELEKIKKQKRFVSVKKIGSITCYQYKNKFEIKENFYQEYLGISDDDIIKNNKYFTVQDGIKIIKPELVFSLKLQRKESHDIEDLDVLSKYALKNPDIWNWKLINDSNYKEKIVLEYKKFLRCKRICLYKKLKEKNKIYKKLSYYLIGLPCYRLCKFNNYLKKEFLGIIDIEKSKKDTKKKTKIFFGKFPLYSKEKSTQVITFCIANLIRYEKKLKNPNFIDYSSFKVLETSALFNNQRDEFQKFQAYDTIVRYGFAEEYLNHRNDEIWKKLYIKMQKCRNISFPDNCEEFKILIESFKAKGYNYNVPLRCSNEQGILLDGSHRLALCLLFNVPYVSFVTEKRKIKTRNYGIDWFEKNDFTNEEISLIENKKNEIFKSVGIYFPCIFWPPINGNIKDAERIIVQNGHNIISKKSLKFNNEKDFSHFVYAAYSSDDIAEWKVARKIAFMKDCKKECNVIWIEVLNPEFRKKQINNNDISTSIENLKKKIRDFYKKDIKDYVYDIICHIGDNFYQNKIINNIINKEERQ